VIVRGEQIIARGYTGAPGAPHAEAAAMLALSPDVRAGDISIFVTLEPCAFHGRTPSCAQALAERGVGAVFVGIIDPDPRNRGKGLRLLREAGILVELGILEEAVHEFLAPYLEGAYVSERSES
jgi:pyrimidine deaminase RibD-like protein